MMGRRIFSYNRCSCGKESESPLGEIFLLVSGERDDQIRDSVTYPSDVDGIDQKNDMHALSQRFY
jgi:hypothetical protein